MGRVSTGDGVQGLRTVHRAASDLRRGTPVLLRMPEGTLLIAAAETVSARGLAEMAAAARGPALLLLAPVRAAAVLQRPVPQAAPGGPCAEIDVSALRLPPALLDPAVLQNMADPTAEHLLLANPELTAAPFGAAAAVALARHARLLPALVAAPATEALAARVDLLAVEAKDVLAYPAGMAASIARVAEARVPLEEAPDARVVAFRAADGGIEHLAILVGAPEATSASERAPLACIHSECFTGDLLGSLRCDWGPQLRGAIQRMAQDPAGGVLLYLAQEGRGIGLVDKLSAVALQAKRLDTLDADRAPDFGADERSFWLVGEMLRAVGLGRVRLLTNNSDKVAGLVAAGIEVERREPHRSGHETR